MPHPHTQALGAQFYHWLHHPFAPIQTTQLFIVVLLIAAVLFVGLMAFLHKLSPQVKKWTTISCTFLAGTFYLIEYLYPVKHDPKTGEVGNFLTASIDPVSNYVNNIFIWAIFLGLISLSIVHGRKLLRRETGWHNSLAFFIAAIAMCVIGAISHLGKSDNHPIYNHWYHSLYDGLLLNFDAAMFALLAFYIISAAYRAFRIRSLEATLLMISALVVMLGMVDFGLMLTSGISQSSPWAFLRLENLSGWILSWVNMSAQRAVMIGVSVGALAMALRLWLSLERGSFFSQE